MGEFFDLLMQTENIQGRIFLEDLAADTDPKDLKEFRAAPFNHEEVQQLCDAVAGEMSKRLHGICTEELYEHVRKDGHQFLQEIGEKAAKEGVDFGAQGTDKNITPTEVMEAAGLVTVVDGLVKPKPIT